ncbi:hypothetical protein [uncultured Cytophaga sp.]|uniref:hypothetical protein n=1 Tax=uncultured Cytophaga sp. TaxID=160238 RepID=UPI002615FBA0|nr:hypothetical protein [uncultured Cytophaga sp.]
MTHQEEKNKERTGLIVSAGIHALFILLFFFVIVWEQPDPPTPGMPGVEINFGFDNAGSGETNTKDPATTEATVTPEQTEAAAATDPADVTKSDLASEHTIPDTKPKEQTPVKVTEPKTNNTSDTKPTDQKVTEKSNPSGDGKSNKTGNQGAEEGKIDSHGLYPGDGGKGDGTGGSGAVSMAGWHLDADPKVDNVNKEAGKVVFSIKIDDRGSIIGINVIETQVGEALIQRCKEEIKRMEFEKNRDNSTSAPFSTGTVTFVFRIN